jgi:L-alanine-DL-glutamate epimerase-like enolase superfamily enzyme
MARECRPANRGGPAVKIVTIQLYSVNVPETRWWWSDDVYGQPQHQRDTHGIAEVVTDDGLVGLTQIERGTPVEAMRSELQSWIGTDVLAVNLQDPRGVMTGSFEQAVLDLRGQALGAPIWQLLGGRLRDRIPVTQCTGYKTPEHTAEDALRGWELGFRTYKMKCITAGETTPEARIRYVTDRVNAIHDLLPEMVVRPDLRWRLQEGWVARELAARLSGHRIDCLESPIAKQSAAGTYSEWRRLRDAIDLPIADHIAAADLPRAFAAGALDYAIVGAPGHLATVDASRLAHHLGMGGWSQTVAYGPGAAMGLHVAACMPNLSQPYDMVGPMAWEHALVNEPFPFGDGGFEVPDRPGLGFTLDRAAVGRYLVDRASIA